MAKHEITIHENTSPTKTVAPYLGSYVSKETVKLEDFIGSLASKCGLPAIQAQAILTGAFDEIEALEAESLVRIHLDGFTVAGVITGSFPSADAAFDPVKNTLELALRPDDDIKYALADVLPTIVTDETSTKVRVDNVMDLETPRPINLIHGQNKFRVAGLNMVLDAEDEKVYLANGAGTTFPVVVDEKTSKQLFTAHTESLLEGGDYKLYVKSRGGDSEGPLQAPYRKVKYLKVAPTVPAPTLTTVNGAAAGGGVSSAAVTLGGTNLSGASVKFYFNDYSGSENEMAATPTSVTDTEIVLPEGWFDGATLGDDKTITFKATTADGTASITGTFNA